MTPHTQPPLSIDLREVEEFALRELKLQHLRNDIILKLCTHTGWDWEQAKRFLDQVYADHKSELAGRERGTAFLINVTLLFEGLLIFIVGSAGILLPFVYNLRTGKFMTPLVDYPITTVFMAFLSGFRYFPLFIVIASIGMGMMAKGVVGIVLAVLPHVPKAN
jgi:hypothetical protein